MVGSVNDPIKTTVNGYELWGVDSNMTEIRVWTWDGWESGASPTSSKSAKVWGMGSFGNHAAYSGKELTISLVMRNESMTGLRSSLAALRAAASVDWHDVVVDWHGSVQMSRMRLSDVFQVKWISDQSVKVVFSEESLSPYVFTAGPPVSGITGLPASVGGMVFPYVFGGAGSVNSWVFPEETVSGMVSLPNGGSAPGAVSLRIDGPCVNPSVEHVQSGKRMTLRLVLGTGHYVTFDGQTHEVLVDGSDPARGAVVRREWSMASPGVNTWAFSAESGSGGARLTVSFREAWL
jgi:hypothetical protein